MIDDEDDVEQPDSDLPIEEQLPNAANAKQLRRRLSKQTLAERESREFWEYVFSTKVGRREMWKILAEAHTFQPEFACGPNGFPQSEATWYRFGEQAFGQRLYQSWGLNNREGVFLMQDENDPRFAGRLAARKRQDK